MLIHNVTSSRALKGDITFEEAWTGNKPSVAHLRIFGCDAYVLVPKAQCRKLDPKLLKCTLIGYIPNCKAWSTVAAAILLNLGILCSMKVTLVISMSASTPMQGTCQRIRNAVSMNRQMGKWTMHLQQLMLWQTTSALTNCPHQ